MALKKVDSFSHKPIGVQKWEKIYAIRQSEPP
jgi:hypothetical protein